MSCRRYLCSMFVVLGCLLLSTVCAAENSSKVVAGERELPVRWCGHHILVDADVGGDTARRLTMVLDTGSTHNVIDPSALARISDVSLDTGDSFRFKMLALGETQFFRVPGWLQDLDHLSVALGTRIDGILGYPTFRNAVLTLDYPGRSVRITTEQIQVDAEALRLVAGRRRPWIDLELAAGTRQILIDSGSSRGFSLRSGDIAWESAPREVGAMTGFSGLESVIVGRSADDIVLGPIRFEMPGVRQLETDGIRSIGAAVLQQFVVIIDGPGERIRLDAESGTRIPRQPVRGFGIGWKPYPTELEIVSLLSGSQAAGAGLRVGDRVLAVNGQSIQNRGCQTPMNERSHLGLTIRRDLQPITVELVAEVLLP